MFDSFLKKLHLYKDANTSDNPSKTVQLTEDTKVSVKGPKLQIEIGGEKTKKFQYKVESGDINKWKLKLEEEIRKPAYDESWMSPRPPKSYSFDNGAEYEYEGETYDDIEKEESCLSISPKLGSKNPPPKHVKNHPPPKSPLVNKKKELQPLKVRESITYDDCNYEEDDGVSPDGEFVGKKAPQTSGKKAPPQAPLTKRPPVSPFPKKPSIDDTYLSEGDEDEDAWMKNMKKNLPKNDSAKKNPPPKVPFPKKTPVPPIAKNPPVIPQVSLSVDFDENYEDEDEDEDEWMKNMKKNLPKNDSVKKTDPKKLPLKETFHLILHCTGAGL